MNTNFTIAKTLYFNFMLFFKAFYKSNFIPCARGSSVDSKEFINSVIKTVLWILITYNG